MWRYSSFVLQYINNSSNNARLTNALFGVRVFVFVFVCVPVCHSNNNIFRFDCVDRRTVLFIKCVLLRVSILYSMNERTATEEEKTLKNKQMYNNHIKKNLTRSYSDDDLSRCQLRVHFWLMLFFISFYSSFSKLSGVFRSSVCLFWQNDVKNHLKIPPFIAWYACLLNLMILIF